MAVILCTLGLGVSGQAASASSSLLGMVSDSKRLLSSRRFDLDGDGKKDSLKIQFNTDEDDMIHSYTLTVGKKSLTESGLADWLAQAEIVDIDKKDNYQEILISLSSDNDFQTMFVYRWDGSAILPLGQLSGGRLNNDLVSIPGDGTVQGYVRMDLLGTFHRTQRYRLKGTPPRFVELEDAVYEVVGDEQQATALRSFRAYKTLGAKRAAVTLRKGETLVRTGTDGKTWLRCQTGSGSVVWIKAAAEEPNSEWPVYDQIAGYGSMHRYLQGFDFTG